MKTGETMKKLALALLMIAGIAAAQTPYYGTPTPIAGYVSSDGSGGSGTWDPLSVSGGVTPYYGTPSLIGGLYYSSDGTGSPGTWYPWKGTSSGGTVSTGTQYALPEYKVAGTTVGPSNISTDSTGNNLIVPGNVAFGGATASYSTANSNLAIGLNALSVSTNLSGNVAVGKSALGSCINCQDDTALGYLALGLLTNNSGNTAIGYEALMNLSGTQYYNTAIGEGAGATYTGGTALYSATNDVFVGTLATAKANSDSNEIVIGSLATGNGSNTVTIGSPGTIGNYFTGSMYVAQYVATTAPMGNALGVVASAATITPTSPMFSLSGTVTISTITLPANFSSTTGGCYDILATGAWSTATGGNIATPMTAISGTQYRACYFGALWYVK